MKVVYFILSIQFFVLLCNGSPFDKVIDSACRTNPTWAICQTTSSKAKLRDDVLLNTNGEGNTNIGLLTTTETSPLNINESQIEIDSSTNLPITSISSILESEEEPKNLESVSKPKDAVFEAANFFNNQSLLFDNTNSQLTSSSPTPIVGNEFDALKQHYCHTYIGNFTNYCNGRERFKLHETLQTRLIAFCDSFKSTCYPMHSIPCTPDCDQRFHPHCTVACKCNYLYPFVIKFCSPVTIHSLEDVCRSWFIKCAKIHAIDD